MIQTNVALKLKPKIFKGESTVRGQFPFFALLTFPLNKETITVCGGSLISDEWVLTAAHCIESVNQAKVYLGLHRIDDDESQFRQMYLVFEHNFYSHFGFNDKGISQDIALVRLPTKVQFNEFIQPIRLTNREFAPNLDLILIGNGVLNYGDDQISPTLQYTELSTIPMRTCMSVFPFLEKEKYLDVFCASSHLGSSACHGDSGGPLISKDDRTLIGISNFGHTMGCDKGFPQVYTHVFLHREWIEMITGLDL